MYENIRVHPPWGPTLYAGRGMRNNDFLVVISYKELMITTRGRSTCTQIRMCVHVQLDAASIGILGYSKTCHKWPPKIDKKPILISNSSLLKVESIAVCSLWNILQYFLPALSGNQS